MKHDIVVTAMVVVSIVAVSFISVLIIRGVDNAKQTTWEPHR